MSGRKPTPPVHSRKNRLVHAQVEMSFTRQIEFEAPTDTPMGELEQMAVNKAKRTFCGEYEKVKVIDITRLIRTR